MKILVARKRGSQVGKKKKVVLNQQLIFNLVYLFEISFLCFFLDNVWNTCAIINIRVGFIWTDSFWSRYRLNTIFLFFYYSKQAGILVGYINGFELLCDKH